MISIIIPTLNEERTIESTLKPVHDGLTDFEHEIIVTDSGSTDRTVEIARQYATVITKREPEKKTISWNKNHGASVAHGEYLVFIDADVQIPEPNRFFKQALARFTADPKLVGLTVNLKVFPKEATFLDKIVFGLVNLDHTFNNNISHFGSASGEFQMIPAKIFKELHGYQEHLAVAEDNDMFARLSRHGRTMMDTSLTVYHTGRRAHEIGWPRVLKDWALNYFSVKLFNRSFNDEWKVIR